MAKVKIIRFKGKKLKDNSHPIIFQITHKGKIKRISFGHSASDDEWDNESSEFTRKKSNYKWLNNTMNKKLNKIEKTILGLEADSDDLSMKEIAFAVDEKLDKKTFYVFTQEIINDLNKAKRYGNAAIYQTVLNVVKTHTNDVDVNFNEIDYKWLCNFETFHLSKEKSINGLGTYMRTIRAVYNKGIKEGYAKQANYPFKDYSIKFVKPKKRAISKADIEKIKNIKLIPSTPIWHSKNYFLFSFYTRGMNWTDMANLKLENIVDGKIEYKRAKTGKAFSIKINDRIQEIIDYYIAGKTKKEYIFPIIKRAKNLALARVDIKNGIKNYNKYLRKIGEACEIDARLTSYVSRHSWGTIGYKELNIPVGIISQGYGHEDAKTTQAYLEEFDDEELDNANDLITS